MSVRRFKSLIDKYYQKKCVISSFSTNQKNHIVPRAFCAKFKTWNQLTYDPNNGFLLTDTLHREYDQFIWSLDVYNSRFDQKGFCHIPVIIAPGKSKNCMIRGFEHKLAKMRIESFPLLWVNYQIFLTANFSKSDVRNEYKEYLESDTFQKISNNPKLFIEQMVKKPFIPSLVIESETFDRKFLVIDRFKSFQEQQWLNDYQINPELIENFRYYREEIFDPDWKPNN